MPLRFTPPRVLIGLTATTCFVGCVALQQVSPLPNLPPVQVPSRVVPDSQATSELRIPGEAVAQANDIPIVPVPPIPLAQSKAARTTAPPMLPPEIKQASLLEPPAQPASTPPAPPTAPWTPPIVSTAASTPTSPTRPAAPALGDLKQIVQNANDTYAKLDSYIARLTRREQINGRNKPEEVMLFKFRKQPWSVYFKWLGTEGHDREVVYVNGLYESKIHTLLAAGDVPLMPAGKRMSLAPDSLLVKSASRNPITEAGLGASIDRLTRLVSAVERGDKSRGTLTDLGEKKREDYPTALRIIEHVIPANVETEIPRGGKRLYGFDTATYLPVLIAAVDDKGQEVEYYRYDNILLNVKLDDADFNPDKLWSPSKKATPAKP